MSSENKEDEKIIEEWLKYFELPTKEMRKQLKQLNFESTTSKNQNILHIACLYTKKESIEILLSINSNRLEKKLDLNLKDKIKGWTPLYYLIDSSDGSETEILQILIKSGSLINISDNYGDDKTDDNEDGIIIISSAYLLLFSKMEENSIGIYEYINSTIILIM